MNLYYVIDIDLSAKEERGLEESVVLISWLFAAFKLFLAFDSLSLLEEPGQELTLQTFHCSFETKFYIDLASSDWFNSLTPRSNL